MNVSVCLSLCLCVSCVWVSVCTCRVSIRIFIFIALRKQCSIFQPSFVTAGVYLEDTFLPNGKSV